MILISDFPDYYDRELMMLDAAFTVDRSDGDEHPSLGARLYGPDDPYQVMLQLCGRRYYGVFKNEKFYWNDDVESLGNVVMENGYRYVRVRCRGGWWDMMYESHPTTHPHPLLWSYAASPYPELLYSNTRPWPRLAALQVQDWLPAETIASRLKSFKYE